MTVQAKKLLASQKNGSSERVLLPRVLFFKHDTSWGWILEF